MRVPRIPVIARLDERSVCVDAGADAGFDHLLENLKRLKTPTKPSAPKPHPLLTSSAAFCDPSLSLA